MISKSVNQKPGLTLIEVLLALLLTGVVLTVALRLTRHSMNVEQTMRNQDKNQRSEQILFDMLRRDLEHINRDSNAAIILADQNVLELNTAARFYTGKTLHPRRLPAQVTYQVIPGKQGNQLLRTYKDMTDAKAESLSMVVLEGFESIAYEVIKPKQSEPQPPPLQPDANLVSPSPLAALKIMVTKASEPNLQQTEQWYAVNVANILDKEKTVAR